MAYYEHPRPDVVALVPADARYVVDVGCASGALGNALKAARPDVEVRGIEPVADVAQQARERLDDVLIGHAEDPMPDNWPAPDCVIFADVLEHLVDPWAVLSTWKERLAPGGTVVASIPNVAHHSVVRGLVRGRFDYVEAGILDRTHLRFFTRRTIFELFERCGLSPYRVERVVDEGRMKKTVQRFHRWGLGPLADPWTIQFLVVAR
jgi:SAM-dependent methyltransferase